VANRFKLQDLLDARHGRPTEARAARTIAVYAVIPAAIAGLLAGTQLVGEADPAARLLWVCSATAFGAGVGAAGLVMGVYRLFGFRPVAVLGGVLVGGFGGLLGGSVLGNLLDSWWPWLLVPLGAVAAPLLLAAGPPPGGAAPDASRTPRSSRAEDQDQ
jgi:peptidoglycan/LPS O-acetylase OafA/YrhL